MPREIITLVPNVGAGIELDEPSYKIGEDVDWGDHVIDPQLAGGSDVVGGVPGVRRREPSEASIPVRVRGTTPSGYVASAEILAAAAAALGQYGGKIKRQVDFGGGDLSEEVQTTVYACDLSPEDGWLQAHRLAGLCVLSVSRDPAWIATEPEVLVTVPSASGATATGTYTARGNLPGPAGLFAIDGAVAERRYWEVGFATAQYQASDSYHYFADQFTAGAASLGTDSDGIDSGSNNVLQLANILPTPQVVGTLADLGNVGTYRVKVRVKGSSEDAQHFVRVLWRQSGGGPWKEIGTAAVPGDATEYWMVDVGTLRNYTATTAPGVDSIDIRVDAYADDATSGTTFSFDTLFLIPAELHILARGIPITQPPLENDIYDGFSDEETADEAVAGTTAPAPSTPSAATWAIIETAATGSNDWLARGAPFNGIRREGPDDGVGDLANGQHLILGSVADHSFTNVTAEAWVRVKHKGSVGTTAMVGPVVRYTTNTGQPNGLYLVARVRRRNDGKYKRFISLYKFTGTTPTITKIKDLWQQDGRTLDALLHIQIDTSGNWATDVRVITSNGIPLPVIKSGTDSAFASAPLNTGRVGFYSLIQSNNDTYAYTEADYITGSAEAVTAVQSKVIPYVGASSITHEGANADVYGGGSQVQIPYVVGSRLWLPPGSGEFVSMVRRRDSVVEPDTGHADATVIFLQHYPAWSVLPDTVV